MLAFWKSDAAQYRPLLSAPRSLSAKFFVLVAVVSLIYLAQFVIPYDLPSFSLSSRTRGTCPPKSWANGKWVPKPPPTNRTDFSTPSDAFEFLGLEGCASSREIFWHLAADNERLWDRFPGVSTWRWQPPSDCEVRDLVRELLVRDLIEQGGWLLIGDSVTENHFFSLSCLLYPHVRATPNYVESPDFDRAWPQNLYLSPLSPLVRSINFPQGFDIKKTPLVTFRRVDLLMEESQLDALYHSLHPKSNLFSDEAVWNLPPSEYVKILTSPLPEGNYATLVVSTAGHWTTTLFAGLKDANKFNDGIHNVVDFFQEAMHAWAQEVQRLLDEAEKAEQRATGDMGRQRAPRQVLARAYLPGHEDCHDSREPTTKYKPGPNGWYNWNQIKDFNRAFEGVLSSRRYPDIHFLPIDRPALLRPDAHSAGDCLHIMTGTGVLEGWSHYIWHYVTVELPGRVR
ncbi:hypothetical protein C8Q80DRAFT_1186117 [Daedaleopsis nitida]|nr:hypothetical protein C8Q80DRAFT_1186117 [Daedaleopsis nitida]